MNLFGFRSRLCADAVLCLKQTVRHYTDRRTPIYACFLNFNKSSNQIPYDKLWQKMRTEPVVPDEIVVIQRENLENLNVKQEPTTPSNSQSAPGLTSDVKKEPKVEPQHNSFSPRKKRKQVLNY